MLKILTIGTFDVPHYGHLRLLQACEQFGEVIVGINSDQFVVKYKGRPPLLTQDERSKFFHELGYETAINTSAGRKLIDKVRPNVVAVGSDWAKKDYLKQIDVTQEWLDERGIMLLYIPYTEGISSSEIRSRAQ